MHAVRAVLADVKLQLIGLEADWKLLKLLVYSTEWRKQNGPSTCWKVELKKTKLQLIVTLNTGNTSFHTATTNTTRTDDTTSGFPV